MMKTLKRGLAAVLAFVMCVGMLNLTVLAVDSQEDILQDAQGSPQDAEIENASTSESSDLIFTDKLFNVAYWGVDGAVTEQLGKGSVILFEGESQEVVRKEFEGWECVSTEPIVVTYDDDETQTVNVYYRRPSTEPVEQYFTIMYVDDKGGLLDRTTVTLHPGERAEVEIKSFEGWKYDYTVDGVTEIGYGADVQTVYIYYKEASANPEPDIPEESKPALKYCNIVYWGADGMVSEVIGKDMITLAEGESQPLVIPSFEGWEYVRTEPDITEVAYDGSEFQTVDLYYRRPSAEPEEQYFTIMYVDDNSGLLDRATVTLLPGEQAKVEIKDFAGWEYDYTAGNVTEISCDDDFRTVYVYYKRPAAPAPDTPEEPKSEEKDFNIVYWGTKDGVSELLEKVNITLEETESSLVAINTYEGWEYDYTSNDVKEIHYNDEFVTVEVFYKPASSENPPAVPDNSGSSSSGSSGSSGGSSSGSSGSSSRGNTTTTTPAPVVEEVVVEEENVPLAETPEVVLSDEQVPLAEAPVVETPDADVPLADVPKTGDSFLFWTVVTLASGTGLAALVLTDEKVKIIGR